MRWHAPAEVAAIESRGTEPFDWAGGARCCPHAGPAAVTEAKGLDPMDEREPRLRLLGHPEPLTRGEVPFARSPYVILASQRPRTVVDPLPQLATASDIIGPRRDGIALAPVPCMLS